MPGRGPSQDCRRWRKSVRYPKSGRFVRLQCNFLREHNVSRDKIITAWVMISGCIITAAFAWAYLRAERRARRLEASRALGFLTSAGLRPPS